MRGPLTGLFVRLMRRSRAIGLLRWARAKAGALPFVRQRTRRRERVFYSQFIGKGDLCFDVGANVGRKTGVFLDLGAIVVAVEPQESCAALLESRYADTGRLTVVRKALGPAEGEAELMSGKSLCLSSLSEEFISEVRRSGRWSHHQWWKRTRVQVTTLDSLIREHGVPRFCKIDVEGYEAKVVEGLSWVIPALSLEFTPELADVAIAALRRIAKLGRISCNYVVGESVRLVLAEWVSVDDMCRILNCARHETCYGDVYVRFDG